MLIERFPTKAEFWLLQANAYLNLKQPLKAAENLECVARLGQSTADSLFTLGDIYAGENLFDLAGRAYTRALAADPDQASSRPTRAVELLAARGGHAQAGRLIAEIQQAMPDRLAAADRRKLLKLQARIAFATGGAGAAVSVLEESITLDWLPIIISEMSRRKRSWMCRR
ncbi:MAG: hypothetical protein FJW34_25685 [Acidobacteria bacterium]|nr:hypothetical protein [Acidobacteriota bacterium]